MAELRFDLIHVYDPGKPGISVPVDLKLGENVVFVTAKLDTGSSFCIFTRETGEALGLDIESGIPEQISTATGSFRAYGHEVTLLAIGFELNAMVYFTAMSDFGRNVLGRHGWMQQLCIGIVDYDGLLYLGLYEQGVS